MIVDQAGQVEDFVAWGYTAAQLAAMSIDFGPFSGITVGDQWQGDGAPIGSPGGEPEVEWTAFNDHVAGAGTHANATTYAANGTSSGPLKDINTGSSLPVVLGTGHSGVRYAGTQGYPAAGTPAYEIFDGYVDLGSGTGASLEIEAGNNDYYLHVFSNLDTSGSVTYDFVGTAVRGNAFYTNRWTLVTLEGAASWTLVPEHAQGIGIVTHDEAPSYVAENQVAIWTGHNSAPEQGYVVHWTNIDPGPDGQFAVRSRQYTGPTPGVGSEVANGTKGYGLSGIRLQELSAGLPLGVLVRSGDTDRNLGEDFQRVAKLRGTDPHRRRRRNAGPERLALGARALRGSRPFALRHPHAQRQIRRRVRRLAQRHQGGAAQCTAAASVQLDGHCRPLAGEHL